MNKKKIVLFGWGGRSNDNFGTNLQTIALYYVLNKKYDTVFLKGIRFYNFKSFVRKCIRKFFHNKSSKLDIKQCHLDLKNTERCFSEINCVKINNTRDYKKILSEYDTFVVGSDQVWNPNFLNEEYLLNFIPKTFKKISYASSIGVNSIPNRLINVYRKNLLGFFKISVREEAGALALRKIVKKTIDVNLDPTLLLSRDEWYFFAKNAFFTEKIPEQFILCYFVGTKILYFEEASILSKKYGLPLVIISLNYDNFIVPLQSNEHTLIITDAGPKEFVYLVSKATYVFTDSFHMSAFSLIFNKQFCVTRRFKDSDKSSQNSRIDFLFSLFDVNCYINDDYLFSNIDYIRINYVEEKKRLLCIKWLYAACDEEYKSVFN